jgi:hypothetical protein
MAKLPGWGARLKLPKKFPCEVNLSPTLPPPISAQLRRSDLDWLRVLVVLLLVPFHSALVFLFIIQSKAADRLPRHPAGQQGAAHHSENDQAGSGEQSEAARGRPRLEDGQSADQVGHPE